MQSEFIGVSMREALLKAKNVLGEDALIVRSEQTEKGVKIYAAKAEESSFVPKEFPVTKNSILMKSNQDNPIDTIKKVVELCERHKLGRHFCDHWLEKLNLKKDKILIEDSLDLNFNEQWLYDLNAKTPVIAVGPYGSGKTAFLGKLAIALVSLKKNFKVISLDEKAGSFEQLSAYMKPLGKNVEKGYTALKQKEELLLVDTPSINILEDQSFLFKLSEYTRDPLTLVLPRDLRADLAIEMVKEFKAYNASYLVGTRFDFKVPLNGFFNSAFIHKLMPVLFSNGPKITEPMNIFTRERAIELLESPLL